MDDTAEHWSEERDLVNPDAHAFDEPSSGLQGAFDEYLNDFEPLGADFSQTVINELVMLLRAASVQRVILCANSALLGNLRMSFTELPHEGVAVYEHANDLVKLTPAQLREYLDAQDLLPARP